MSWVGGRLECGAGQTRPGGILSGAERSRSRMKSRSGGRGWQDEGLETEQTGLQRMGDKGQETEICMTVATSKRLGMARRVGLTEAEAMILQSGSGRAGYLNKNWLWRSDAADVALLWLQHASHSLRFSLVHLQPHTRRQALRDRLNGQRHTLWQINSTKFKPIVSPHCLINIFPEHELSWMNCENWQHSIALEEQTCSFDLCWISKGLKKLSYYAFWSLWLYKLIGRTCAGKTWRSNIENTNTILSVNPEGEKICVT